MFANAAGRALHRNTFNRRWRSTIERTYMHLMPNAADRVGRAMAAFFTDGSCAPGVPWA
ncbi:hypothetical protein AB0395_07905 [Streptosporangium sp. NPDC051023]|uniref:hypothetical protein n=1 Tax=Streptosporangium sp. NPDC051023 TaxID=3155410 RepID=UPI00344CE405